MWTYRVVSCRRTEPVRVVRFKGMASEDLESGGLKGAEFGGEYAQDEWGKLEEEGAE